MEKRDRGSGFFWKKREGANRIYSERIGLGRDSGASLMSRIFGAFILSIPGQTEKLQVVKWSGFWQESSPMPLRWWCRWYHDLAMLGAIWRPLWWLETTSHLGICRIYELPGFHSSLFLPFQLNEWMNNNNNNNNAKFKPDITWIF